MRLPDTTPELLSPAGNWDCARAAVAAGADAIYFGLPRFNARLRAVLDRLGFAADEKFVVRATGEHCCLTVPHCCCAVLRCCCAAHR